MSKSTQQSVADQRKPFLRDWERKQWREEGRKEEKRKEGIEGSSQGREGRRETQKKNSVPHLFHSQSGRQEAVNMFPSAFGFILSTSRTKALWRGTQDVLAANITVEFQFYLRESSFIKSHDWNCMTGANILHPDRCVSLRVPFPVSRLWMELRASSFVSLPARSHTPVVCLRAAPHRLICGILTMRLIKRQSIIFI